MAKEMDLKFLAIFLKNPRRRSKLMLDTRYLASCILRKYLIVGACGRLNVFDVWLEKPRLGKKCLAHNSFSSGFVLESFRFFVFHYAN